MENLLTFIPEHLLILIAATYVVGMFLKGNPGFKDTKITVALMIFSVVGSVLLTLINTEYTSYITAVINAVFQGILCWGVAVGINQTSKQLKKQE